MDGGSTSLGERRFRANPKVRLKPYNHLSAAEDNELRALSADRDGFGILLPTKGCDLPPREVDADTALLVYSLQEPGPLPEWFIPKHSRHDECQIVQLVFDGILEIEHEGMFVSGAAAAPIVGSRTNLPAQASQNVSHAALRYAATLGIADEYAVAGRLYRYNTVPITRKWRDRFANGRVSLGLTGLDRVWEISGPAIGWYFAHRQGAPRRQTGAKLYVSPHPSAIAESVRTIANELAKLRSGSFKVGAGAEGALRPDKIVAYFDDLDGLFTAAGRLQSVLDGCPAQGTPFSVAFSADHLLSWGIDPKPDQSGGAKSWRQWVVERLAHFLSAARTDETGREEPAWQTALRRIEIDGIEAETFRPTGLWITAHT